MQRLDSEGPVSDRLWHKSFQVNIYICLRVPFRPLFLSAITVHPDPYRYIKGLYLWPAISISTLHWILYDEQAA